jgi:hypothetical protein
MVRLAALPVVAVASLALVWLTLAHGRGGDLDESSDTPSTHVTGSHWGTLSDLGRTQRLGYGFAVRTVDTRKPATWRRTLDAAQASGMKLIIGGDPEPYSYADSEWSITPGGVRLLRYLKSRSKLVLAVFVFNEPFWLNPATGRADACGAMSADALRALRAKIRTIWSNAKVYHDIGRPSRWAPGGSLHRIFPCIGGKYADTRDVADYVGVWYYPFREDSYRKRSGLEVLASETSFVRQSMGAVPVWLNQAHACCEDLVWPTREQLGDWNCATRRALAPGSLLSWYPWRQQKYPDYLAKHPEHWRLTTADACRPPIR